MILSSLHLENFKRYKSYNIEFSQGLIGIIGKNGSGKSTIFEAILFGLYGEAKTRGNKELLRNSDAGEKETVTVELEFEFEGILYKVVREFRGKVMKAEAKLYRNDELNASGAKEVTNAIIKLTKMSKEAFGHTLFASQKELTSLSTLKPEERKKMIRRLLGLEKIDFVEKELIEKSRELKREIEAFKEVLLGEDEIKQKQEQIKECVAAKEALSKEVLSKSEELEHIKTRQLGIKKELEILSKTKELKQKLFSELELAKNSKSSEIMNQVKLTAELHELEDKEEKLKKLQSAKTEYMSLQEQIKEQNRLRDMYLKKEGLQKEQTELREQYKKSKEDIGVLEKEVQNYDDFVLNAKNLEVVIATLQESVKTKHTIESELQAEIKSEQRQIDAIDEKITNLKKLGSEGACPTCTRPLLQEYDNVVHSLARTVNEVHEKNIEAYKKQLQNTTTQKNTFEEQKKDKEKEFRELTKNINIIESKLKDLKKAKEYFLHVEQKDIKNKAELKELQIYDYNDKIHESIKNSITALEPKYRELHTLEGEVKKTVLVKTDLQNTTKKIEELNLTCKSKEEEFKSVVYDDVRHKHQLDEHESIPKTIEKKTALLNEIKVSIASIDGEIKTVQNSLENNETQLKKVQNKKDNLADYEKIKTSLGEFKTTLNSKVAPRISAIASDMYATITKGKYQHIEVSNDFDFFIYDEGRKYPIERFSGGEIDLANLVLRIAISKTLTELNGASSMEFLAFDEVFGSQDENRRMEVLEAFHTIKEQYRQIFLISHETEIKEMFERVVEL